MLNISMQHARNFLLCLVSVLFFVGAAQAASPAPHIERCLRKAAANYGLPYEIVYAVARVESSFNPLAVNRSNANGTRDIGLMQINSAWLPTLERYGISERTLYEPCVNANVGAWILAQNVQRYGYTVNAIGSYNAGPNGKPALKLRYAAKVIEAYHQALSRRAVVVASHP